MIKDKYTFITGAGQGLGKAMATECARRHMNLLLVSLPGENLRSFTLSLEKQYKIRADYLETDLTAPDELTNLYHWTHNKGYTIHRIINNAGIGSVGPFISGEPAFYRKQLDLNVKVPVLLTRLFIEELAEEPEARILNIASLASFFPMPYKTVYASTKGFIYTFSRALRMEYLHTPLRISVACPGPILTNQQVRRRIREQGFLSRKIAWSSEHTARLCINGMLKGKALILPGFVTKIAFWGEKIIPLAIKIKAIALRFQSNPPS